MALGVQCTYLKYTELSLEKKVESKFKRADIIYLNGGNTIFYMQMIRKYGLDKHLKIAMERNAIMCGISAGAIIYNTFGSSDSRTYKNNENKLCETLESIKDFDEIIVIDEHSSDDTVEIAKEYKAKVIYADKNNLPLALNQALEESKNEWIFIINENP